MPKPLLPKVLKEKLSKKELQKQLWGVFSFEAILFTLTSFLTVLGGYRLGQLSATKQIYLPTTSLQDFLISFFVGTLVVVAMVFSKKSEKFKPFIYRGFFLLTSFWGGMALLNLFLPVALAIAVMGILLFIWIQKPTVWLHDLLMILAMSGVATFLGLEMTTASILIILVLFSVYDFIAVYKTKHMVLMAKEMVAEKVIFGFIIPKEFSGAKDSLKTLKFGGNHLILGGGDIVLPNILVASLVQEGVIKAIVVAIFSLVGMFVSYKIFSSQKEKEPIPALPPIALCSIIGYLVTVLF